MQPLVDLILKNKLVKLCGIFLILYYGVYNNDRPGGLGERLSEEKVKEGVKDARDQSYYILEQIRKAKELEASRVSMRGGKAEDKNIEKKPDGNIKKKEEKDLKIIEKVEEIEEKNKNLNKKVKKDVQ